MSNALAATFCEIFEFTLNPGNDADIQNACLAFSKAGQASVPGLVSMRFLRSHEKSNLLWQMIEWKDEAALKAGQKSMFALPEMSLFSAFLATPPRRIGNFSGLANAN